MIDAKFLEECKNAVIDGEQELAIELANKAIEAGYDPKETIEEGFIPGIMEVGDMFEDGEIFLPEVMMSADTIKGAVDILNTVLEKAGNAAEKPAKVVLATVEADLHDIGKGIVASIMVANGFEVIDLGRDVPSEKIVQTAIDENADVIGTSALLTTTMVHQKEIEDMLAEKGLKGKIKTIVGGAPVTTRWQNKIGADGFGENASDDIRLVNEFIATK